jgi:hypothetical protein
MATIDARCASDIKCNIAIAIAAFNKKAFFTSKLDIN